MATVHLLRDVDIEAISLVTKGANRKRIFLRKRDGEDGAVTVEGTSRLVKSTDAWSTVYCVVAEPDWEENAGQHGNQDVPDVWASPEEIQKAAWRFMRNGALVNKMHESLDRYGHVVENFIAPVDFSPEGSFETIKKGSWVIAIQPNDEGKAAIEDGTFTGVSIQGSGTREKVDKAFDEYKHPRGKKGTSEGGRFVAADNPREARRQERNARHVLRRLGYGKGLHLKNDRQLGRAIRRFQRHNGLKPDGIVGEKTRDKIRSMNLRSRGASNPSGWSGPSPATSSISEWNRLPAKKRKRLAERFMRSPEGLLPRNRAMLDDGRVVRDNTDFNKPRKGKVRKADKGKDKVEWVKLDEWLKALGLDPAKTDLAKDAALVPNKPGVTNWVERSGGLPKFLADIAGDLITERGKSVSNAIQMAWGIVRNWCGGKGNVTAKTRAKACAAAAAMAAKAASAGGKPRLKKAELIECVALAVDPELLAKVEPTDADGSLSPMDGPFLRAIAKMFGKSEEEIDQFMDELEEDDEGEDLAKGEPSFASRMAERELDKDLPDAMNILRSVIWGAFYPPPDTDYEPREVIERSLDEFKEWALATLDQIGTTPVEKQDELRKQVARDLTGSENPPEPVNDPGTVGDMALTAAEKQELATLTKRANELLAKDESDPQADPAPGETPPASPAPDTSPASEPAAPANGDAPADTPASGDGPVSTDSNPEAVAKLEEKLDKKMDEVLDLISKLEEGKSSQVAAAADPQTTAESDDKLAKAYKDRGLDPALRGIF